MTTAPKIYNWIDTQLSFAQHYGGIKINGVPYTIDYTDPERPLIRDGMPTLLLELKTAAAAAKKADKQRAKLMLKALL